MIDKVSKTSLSKCCEVTDYLKGEVCFIENRNAINLNRMERIFVLTMSFSKQFLFRLRNISNRKKNPPL